MSTAKRSVEEAEENTSDTKQPKVDGAPPQGYTTVYSLMCLQPNYQNGGSMSSFEIFTTLNAALDAKQKFVEEYAFDDFNFNNSPEEEEEENKLPLYDYNCFTHEGVHGYDKEYIYCEVEEIDLTKGPNKNGAVFFTRLNC